MDRIMQALATGIRVEVLVLRELVRRCGHEVDVEDIRQAPELPGRTLPVKRRVAASERRTPG
jgi:hypothetical protein